MSLAAATGRAAGRSQRARLEVVVGAAVEVLDQNREPRNQHVQPRDRQDCRIEQLLERTRGGPAAGYVADQHGDDRRKRATEPPLLASAVPDPVLEREPAQRHHRILGALVLEQEEQEGGRGGPSPGREQEVIVLVGEFGVDERARLVLDGLPRDRVADGCWQQLAHRDSVGSLDPIGYLITVLLRST